MHREHFEFPDKRYLHFVLHTLNASIRDKHLHSSIKYKAKRLMRKLAIFVEGQTELIFVERLLDAIAGVNRILFIRYEARGGASYLRRLLKKGESAAHPDHKYFIQIIDCGTDNKVVSDIKDNYVSLVASGFEAIIGLRDLRGENHGQTLTQADLPRVLKLCNYGLKTVPVRVTLVIAVMELEAWFLAEHTHFLNIDKRLTCAFIQANHGFDPSTDDMEARPQPSNDLSAIYNLVGKTYKKRRSYADRTIEALDVARIYAELGARLDSLQLLSSSIDSFLAT